jgi:hypothetical protein
VSRRGEQLCVNVSVWSKTICCNCHENGLWGCGTVHIQSMVKVVVPNTRPMWSAKPRDAWKDETVGSDRQTMPAQHRADSQRHKCADCCAVQVLIHQGSDIIIGRKCVVEQHGMTNVQSFEMLQFGTNRPAARVQSSRNNNRDKHSL